MSTISGIYKILRPLFLALLIGEVLPRDVGICQPRIQILLLLAIPHILLTEDAKLRRHARLSGVNSSTRHRQSFYTGSITTRLLSTTHDVVRSDISSIPKPSNCARFPRRANKPAFLGVRSALRCSFPRLKDGRLIY